MFTQRWTLGPPWACLTWWAKVLLLKTSSRVEERSKMVPLRCRTNGHQRSKGDGASVGRQVSSVHLTRQLPMDLAFQKLVLCSLGSEWIILWCKWIDSWIDLAVPSQWIKRKNKGKKRSLISKKIAHHHVWLVKSIFPSITCVLLHMPVILVEEFDHTVTPRLCFKEKVSMIHLFLHIENAYWATVRYLVLGIFGSDPPEDLGQRFHASFLLLGTCSQDKLKRGEEILGFSEPRSFLCVVKRQREKLTESRAFCLSSGSGYV